MSVRNKKAMFTSVRPDWRTPTEFYHQLDQEFGFALDAASEGPKNAYGEAWLTPDDNALWRSWGPGPTFCNPPYGPKVGEWVEKAWREAGQGVTVVLLLPARVDTRWFHDYCLTGADEIRFVRGRLKFDDGPNSAPFPSMVVVFRGAADECFHNRVQGPTGKCLRCGTEVAA